MNKDNLDKLSLLKRYQSLLIENDRLKTENKQLKDRLNSYTSFYLDKEESPKPEISLDEKEITIVPPSKSNSEPLKKDSEIIINKYYSPTEKIKLFMGLFKGREDIYAKRWENKNNRTGYAPVCSNEWVPGICSKPKIKCMECTNQAFEPLTEKVIEKHLKGEIVVGLYPMNQDESCCFLAIDFDDEGWKKDISIIRDVCEEFNIPRAVERSRSGKGGHVWFFFEEQVPAATARKFGSSLLTFAMNKRHEIKFKSYDRFFPNQDTMPKGGLGNLIALPLQMEARQKGNSLFVDEEFNPYPDQWEFLGLVKKLSFNEIERLTRRLSSSNESELGALRKDDNELIKPWDKITFSNLTQNDFPRKINIVEADMLYVLKEGISQKALNRLKRLAAFKNPEFYKAQAMRMPTYNKPRIISCSDETDEYLWLPRGCKQEVENLLSEYAVDLEIEDKTNHGKKINIEFNGSLRDEQLSAYNNLVKYNNGVLAAATAFGKTIVAAKLIAEKKTNTLIIVHRKQLLSQWIEKLSEFLVIKEVLSPQKKKSGRKKQQSLIGQICGGKENLTAIIDVAIMQSLNRDDEILHCVKEYGLIIVDECHHIPAFSFERVLKNADAKYIYGLTATPTRLDGHHPIINMYCGPIRFNVDAKMEAEQRPFEHFVIPRFTSFKIFNENTKAQSLAGGQNFSVQKLYSELVDNELRNQLIVDDIVKSYNLGRNSLILTERTAHVELLAKKVSQKISGVEALTGKVGIRKTKEIFKRISEIPPGKPLTLIATGKYIGEGFDEPRLDTLFLAMPVSWKGTLQQYVGRLHRLYRDKNEVLVYDYVDIHVPVLERMYNKRLSGYASFGYKIKADIIASDTPNFIFNKNSFFPVYCSDIINAQEKVFLVTPFITRKRVEQMEQFFDKALDNNIKITIITRPYENSTKWNSSRKDRGQWILKQILESLNYKGIEILFKPNIHQKFAIIDDKIVWYGSINLLSFGKAEESIMRLESSNIANELMKSMMG